MADNWRKACAYAYIAICVFDFIVVPVWIGLNRVDMVELAGVLATLPDDIRAKVLDTAYRVHSPFTLIGSGLFHLAFGALLTGAAITGRGERPQ